MKKIIFAVALALLGLSGKMASAAITAAAAVANPVITTKLSLLADDDKLVSGETVKVRVWLKSRDLINVVSGKIIFDPNVFAIQKIDKLKSVASLWLFEPKAKSATSSVRFGGAMIYPGFEGEGELFNIDLKVIGSATSSSLYIADEEIFAADGTGDRLAIATTSYKAVITQTAANITSGFNKFSIISYTHEQGAWSNKTRASFNWPAGYQAAFSFNTLSGSDPGRGTKKQTNASFDIKKDGTYYFHLRARDKTGASKLLHYRIRIDTKKPSDFFVLTDMPMKIGGTLNVKVKARDALSGISYFNIILDGRGKRIVGAEYSVVLKQAGSHRLTVRAFDRAGNYQETTKSFIIN